MHSLVEQNRSGSARLCRQHHVRRLEVFGSAARGTDFDPQRSDADFLVEFDSEANPVLEAFFGPKDALGRLLHRKVDLVEFGAVRNAYVSASIKRAREVVHGS